MSKVALVTGSSKGIGKEIIRELASNGMDVVINYNTSKDEAYELEKEISKYNVRSLVIKCDVSNEEEVKSMIEEIHSKLGSVDILVNNAAVNYNDFFYKKSVEDFKRTMDVNVIGAFLVSKYVSKDMINNKWGRIINISSTNGINTYYPVCLDYDASKAALISLTHNMAIEFAPYINVNAITPGFIGTESELEGMDEEFIKNEEEKILVKRMGTPRDVAKLVKFLVSDDASFINNSVIRVDGGQYGSN
ncbi:MAG: SDR family oxidoreductase [Bacilli bacterium]|nr:SDR family oxidoreductase [Bacilli bacterium]